MIASLLLFCQLTLADLTDEQITKLISRLQSKAEREGGYNHYTRGTTYAIPHSNVPPAVPFTHRVMTGVGSPGPKSRITIRSPKMPNPKGCRCMPHCPHCTGQCSNCTCIFENPEKKLIRTDLSRSHR